MSNEALNTFSAPVHRIHLVADRKATRGLAASQARSHYAAATPRGMHLAYVRCEDEAVRCEHKAGYSTRDRELFFLATALCSALFLLLV